MQKMTFTAAALAIAVAAGTAQAQLINEYAPNPTGGDPDTQFIELLGTPGEAFSGVLILVEGEATSPSGFVDAAIPVSGTFDASGLLVTEIDDLENPSNTLFLLDSFTGEVGVTDLDTDDDGVAETLDTVGTVLDAIGIVDVDGDFSYAGQFGGVDVAFTGDEPQLVFRDSFDPSTVLAVNDPAGDFIFDQDGNSFEIAGLGFDPTVATFGLVNPSVVPEPASLGLLGVAGLALLRRRK